MKEIIGISKILINKDRAGVRKEMIKFMDSEGNKFLLKSFKASLNGWRIPISPTLFGPLRIWI